LNVASVEEVRANMLSTGFDGRCVHLVPGKVEGHDPAVGA
jgi:hypothetical protein